jgi:hypothetical protein
MDTGAREENASSKNHGDPFLIPSEADELRQSSDAHAGCGNVIASVLQHFRTRAIMHQRRSAPTTTFRDACPR